MSVRAVPFYCPFCGEQDIRPDDAGATSWRCESCERHFDLTVTSAGTALKHRSDSAKEGALKQRSDSASGGDR